MFIIFLENLMNLLVIKKMLKKALKILLEILKCGFWILWEIL